MRALLLFFVAAGGLCADWEEVDREAGIVVHQRAVPGRDLPTFRGAGVIEGSIWEVMAVIADSSRRCEWLHRCVGARDIERLGEFSRVIYSRTDAPWPVDDRDVVLKTRLRQVEPGKRVSATFRAISHPAQPPVSGVVRMPYVKGRYELTAEGPGRTRVVYQVDADPGGWLPTWLAKRATRDLPMKTLHNLRAQVRRTRGQYESQVEAWKKQAAGGQPG